MRSLRWLAPGLLLSIASCGVPVTSGPGMPGAVCATADDCGSDFCVDGVCCASACEGPCVSCAVEGQAGQCTEVPEGRDLRKACLGEGGTCAGACDGAGACRFPGAELWCSAPLCAGAAVQQAACDGQGACAVRLTPCAPYGCVNGACATGCAHPLECAPGGTCTAAGACESKLPPGSPCASGAACASGYCADGVCCDRPCGGTCESCNLPQFAGTCTAIGVGDDPDQECPGVAPCGAACDGQGGCAFAAAGTTCGPSTCLVPDAPLTLRACTGAGTCAETPSSCGLFACLGGACRTTCGSASDCQTTAFCAGGQCVPRRSLGQSCAASDECLAAVCVQGVCCTSGCGAPCESCSSQSPGLCSPMGPGATPQPACASGQACGQGTACPASCSATAPCAAGFYCASGTCVTSRPVGDPCSYDAQCATGACASGVCCASSCAGSPCRSCNLTTASAGQCLPQPWGTPSAGCAGLYACRADGLCASGNCADDRDCKPQAFCAGATQGSGGCAAQKANGQVCGRARECASGNCVDGVCCNTACVGACRACHVPGASTGTCTSLPNSTDAFAECTGGYACNGAGGCHTSCTGNAQCEAGFVCQGGACVPATPRGQPCTGGAQCATGFCADGVCCDTACGTGCYACDLPQAVGTCTAEAANSDPAPASCPGGFTCTGSGACRTTCATSANCKAGYGCQGGACVLLLADGAVCAQAAQCQSGHCRDGVCCGSACAGACEACNVAGTVGSCKAFPPGTDPQAECTAGNTCNGFSACGATCAVDTQCAAGHFCNAGACAPKGAKGAACAAANQCQSGQCFDGVCCQSACGGDCRHCALAGTVGDCTFVGGGTDPFNECPGGLACNGAGACYQSCAGPGNCKVSHYCQGGACVPDLAVGDVCSQPSQCPADRCVDGYCCQNACTGLCRSCGLAGQGGTCAPIPGGQDPAIECGPTFCNGSLACISPCAGDGDCKTGNFCDAAQSPAACAAKRPQGDVCAGNNQCQSGLCRDGRCCDGPCAGGCEACDVPGAFGQCTSIPAGEDPDLECGLTWCDGAGMCLASCGGDMQCKATAYCAGSACAPKLQSGSPCGAPNACESGFCASGVCCDAACTGGCETCAVPVAGACTPRADGATGSPSCAPYLCDGTQGSCPQSCAQKSDCAAGNYCTAQFMCAPLLGSGQACGMPGDCQSGHCVDGVCCDTPCTGDCQQCDLGGAVGTCSPMPNGAEAPECGNYVCQAGACRTTCGNASHCQGALACVLGECVL